MGLKPHFSHCKRFTARLKSCPFAHIRPSRVFHQAGWPILMSNGMRGLEIRRESVSLVPVEM
jgi:hypothetical protein